MKKILVLSDSHGNLNNMLLAVRATNPDMVIHLGDGWSDAVRLKKKYPELPIEQVPGNCDSTQEFSERILLIEGQKILICHGHTYHVKSGLLTLELAAREKEVDIAMFGHTHRVYYDWKNGVRLFNPGSIGAPGFGVAPSYGMMTLDQETGRVQLDVHDIRKWILEKD